MATLNAVNTNLSGATGIGNFVGATSPTLITPTVGVATATSINFGGSALSNYAKNSSWTPVVTFATPGNLSVSYAGQVGIYSQIGNIVILQFQLQFTPTYTTASGALQITGSPFTSDSTSLGSAVASGVNYDSGYNQINTEMAASSSTIMIYETGSGKSIAFLGTSTLTSGNPYLIYGSLPILTT